MQYMKVTLKGTYEKGIFKKSVSKMHRIFQSTIELKFKNVLVCGRQVDGADVRDFDVDKII